MLHKFILSILALLIAVTNLACTCAQSEQFNLVEYDSYNYIFEVKIKSKYTLGSNSLNKDSLSPPSVYRFNLVKGFNVSMIEVFKGDIKLTEKIMNFPTGSSCSWTPEIGNTYIFYANSLNDVEMCNRILIKEHDEKTYLKEKSILQSLKNKPSEVKIKLNDKVIIEGTHLNGVRDGIWRIYSMSKGNEITLKLTYRNGNLLFVEKGTGYSEEEEWHLISYSYFTEQTKNKD